jgi:hypothetical protein
MPRDWPDTPVDEAPTQQEWLANGNFIPRACNAHAQLVEACETDGSLLSYTAEFLRSLADTTKGTVCAQNATIYAGRLDAKAAQEAAALANTGE